MDGANEFEWILWWKWAECIERAVRMWKNLHWICMTDAILFKKNFSVIYLICMWSFGLVFFYSYEVLFGFIDRFWDQLKKHHEFSKMA